MKILLGIVFLFFMFSVNLFAGEVNVKKPIKFEKDIMQGYKTKWRFSCTITEDNKCMAPEYAYNVVEKQNNFPVRLGDKSVRFEIRSGDCHQWKRGGYNDCKAGPPAERHEIVENAGDRTVSQGTTWHAHSMYLPKDTPKIRSEWITMGQFHNWETSYPPINFDLYDRENRRYFELVSRFGCQQPDKYKKKVSCYAEDRNNRIVPLIENENLFGKWHDFIINAKWTSNSKKGYFKLWVNGKLAYHFIGRTIGPGNQIEMHFGIYRGAAPKNTENSTHIVYYDEIRFAKKTCKKLKLKDLGYSCKELEKQIIDTIHTISELTTEIGKLSKEERYVKTLTDRISKKIIRANSLSEGKATKVIKWVNKELKKWAKKDSDAIDTIEGRKKKIQSLTKKGMKKFK